MTRDEEEEIRQKAIARQRQFEDSTGYTAPEEPGIQEDTTIEDTALDLASLGGSTPARRAGMFALNKAKGAIKRGLISKMKDRLPSAGGVPQEREMPVGMDTGYVQQKYDIQAEPGRIVYTKKDK